MAHRIRRLQRRQIRRVCSVLLGNQILCGGHSRGWHVEITRGSQQKRTIPVGLALLGQRLQGKQCTGVIHRRRTKVRHPIRFEGDPPMCPRVEFRSVPEDLSRNVRTHSYSGRRDR